MFSWVVNVPWSESELHLCRTRSDGSCDNLHPTEKCQADGSRPCTDVGWRWGWRVEGGAGVIRSPSDSYSDRNHGPVSLSPEGANNAPVRQPKPWETCSRESVMEGG